MSVDSDQRAASQPAVAHAERIKGVGVGIVGPLTIVAMSMAMPVAFRAPAVPLIAAVLVVFAVLTAAWSRTIALAAALTVITVNIAAFVAQLAIGLLGLVPTDGSLSSAANAWLGALILLGTSSLVTILAAAFLGGWALRRVLDSR